jgi:hypothetical protein
MTQAAGDLHLLRHDLAVDDEHAAADNPSCGEAVADVFISYKMPRSMLRASSS